VNLREKLRDLLVDWQPGHVMRTSYDTAWVARLGDVEPSLNHPALNWICDHQLPDGSWGAPEPIYYHDRVICTLAAMTALCRQGRRSSDRRQIELGLDALERITSGATIGLMADPNGATAGFETIVPTLVAEAEALGIIKRQGTRILGRLAKLRAAKLERLSGKTINRFLSIAFSAEMAGPDHTHLLDTENLQESNGSVAYSPSTTAYFARHVHPGDTRALEYLKKIVDPSGGAPIAYPFDVYERAWVLWNLLLSGEMDEETRALCIPHVDALQAAWNRGKGAGWGSGYSIQDGDDTSVVFSVLDQFNRRPDIGALWSFEEPTRFRTFDLEVNASPSTNVHFLDVFRRMGLDRNHPAVQKVLTFLRESQSEEGFWLDKWHVSPFYVSAHVLIAGAGYDLPMAERIVNWFIKMQNLDGSWGFFSSTAEETAYVLQALVTWHRSGREVSREVIRRGAVWLEDHSEPPYPALWIAKTLYYSEWVIRAEILSALLMASTV